jgi:hypothetical protein
LLTVTEELWGFTRAAFCHMIVARYREEWDLTAFDLIGPFQSSQNRRMAKQKFGTHMTVHSSALKRSLDVIIGLPSVDRIIIGLSKGMRHGRPVGSIKLKGIMPTGVEMMGYGDRGITSFFIVTSKPEVARQEIAKKFGIT